MTDEIKTLKANIKTLRQALTAIELIQPLIKSQSTERLYNGLTDSPLMKGLLETAESLDDTMERTAYEYSHAIEYFESRVRTLQSLEREEKYKVKANLRKKKAEPKTKAKPLQVTFSPVGKLDRFNVLVGNEAIGVIRRTKTKYVSGTAKVFTAEAMETRQFVKDGLLQVEDKDLFSTTKFKSWVIDRQPESIYKSFGDAAVELIAQRLPEGVKVTL